MKSSRKRLPSSRVVIASTGSRARAFPSKYGGYFSDAFFTALGDNADLWTAYLAGRMAAQVARSEQTPWLDDNGDAVADGRDGDVARQRGLASFAGGSIPAVDWVEISEINASGVATITAQIRDDVAVLTATVDVYPPGMTVPDRRGSEAGGEVDVAVTVDVEDVRPSCLLPDEGGTRSRDGVDAGRLQTSQAVSQLPRPGPGRGYEDLREQVAAAEMGDHGGRPRRVARAPCAPPASAPA